MTVIKGQVQVDAAELGPAIGKLLDLLAEQKLPIWISRDGQRLAEVLPAGELLAVHPQLQVDLLHIPVVAAGDDLLVAAVGEEGERLVALAEVPVDDGDACQAGRDLPMSRRGRR